MPRSIHVVTKRRRSTGLWPVKDATAVLLLLRKEWDDEKSNARRVKMLRVPSQSTPTSTLRNEQKTLRRWMSDQRYRRAQICVRRLAVGSREVFRANLSFIRRRGRGINRARTTALLPREKHIYGSNLRPYFSTMSIAIFSPLNKKHLLPT